MNEVVVSLDYYFKGSSNIYLHLKQNGDDIDIVTDYGERITSVQTAYGLMRVIQDLMDEKYA